MQPEKAAFYVTGMYNFQDDIERCDAPTFPPSFCIKCRKQIKLNSDDISLGSAGAQCGSHLDDLLNGVPESSIHRISR